GAKRRVSGRALHRTETLTKKSERSGRDMNLIFADALSIDRVAITMFVNVAPRNVDPIGPREELSELSRRCRAGDDECSSRETGRLHRTQHGCRPSFGRAD